MKLSSLIATSLFALSFSALACSQFEAQFAGQVTDLKIDNAGICHFKIDFSSFKEHTFCPLSYGAATANEFQVKCSTDSVKNGDSISGYIIEKQGQIFIED